MSVDVAAVCAAFGLGAPLDRPAVTGEGGSSAGRWLVRTVEGEWLVKTQVTAGEWQLAEMRRAGTLERAAAHAGVPVPRPLEPGPDGVGLWAPVEGGCGRVTAWLPSSPAVDDDALAGWIGGVLAAIERLDLPADPTVEAAYVRHSLADWSGWLDEAVAAGTIGRAGDVLAAVTDASALVDAALAAGPAFRLLHRDVSRANVLATPAGPVLLDFDYAGPEVPWWEAVHHAHNLADGRRAVFTAVLAAHADGGGAAGPASVDAFAGLVRSRLEAFAYNIWLAVGHRPVDARRREQAVYAVRFLADELPALLAGVETWAGWLH